MATYPNAEEPCSNQGKSVDATSTVAKKVDIEVFSLAVRNSFSVAEALRKLGRKPRDGGQYEWFYRWAKRFGVFYNHFLGKASLKGRAAKNRRPVLEWRHKGSHAVRLGLIRDGIKKPQCEICHITHWQGKKTPLELHHIDGNRNNWTLNNLQILCPNCHAQTSNYCSKNRNVARDTTRPQKQTKWKNHCKQCGKPAANIYCSLTCNFIDKRRVKWPTQEELQKLIWEIPIIEIAKRFKVTNNSVNKWCKSYNIQKPPFGYWQRKHAEENLMRKWRNGEPRSF